MFTSRRSHSLFPKRPHWGCSDTCDFHIFTYAVGPLIKSRGGQAEQGGRVFNVERLMYFEGSNLVVKEGGDVDFPSILPTPPPTPSPHHIPPPTKDVYRYRCRCVLRHTQSKQTQTHIASNHLYFFNKKHLSPS